ncbi:MAG TPA: hypothetical protein PLD55_13505 [bacterium]|nr:hypothetical protein [bacterium]
MLLIKPSPAVIDEYLKKWDSLDSYVMQESSLKKLFTKTYPLNNDMDEILIKVCSLNDFYSTNIFSPFKVAMHIRNIEFDKRLKENDLGLVNELANVQVNEEKKINFYSFATKYCSHHKPETYPIFDSYVEKLLLYFKKEYNFSNFRKTDLKQFIRYREILEDFRRYFGLDRYNLKEIDKYLWQAGKEYFPRKY